MDAQAPLYGHTGRELELMLKSEKPLAMFCDDPDRPFPGLIPESEFDLVVGTGRFVKASKVFLLAMNPKPGRRERIRYVLYALKEESWRIPALFLVIDTMLKVRELPNEAIDRLMSRLLGYIDQEIDAHYGIQARKP